MRRLLPLPAAELDDDDLFAAYAYPVHRPWVRGVMVASADGAASAQGRSGGLSSPGDRRVFRLLRGLADVVLVGAGTVRAEGYAAVLPKETWPERRQAAGQQPTATLAVVSRSLELDPASALFTGRSRTIVVSSEAADPARVGRLRAVADVILAGADTVDLAGTVAVLADRGLGRIQCEGGPALLADLARAGCLDELCLTLSPQLLGGSAARILDGPLLEPAQQLRVGHVLEDEGSLFVRYVR